MDALNISLKNGTKIEQLAKDRLLALLDKYDISAYLFTKEIQIESQAIPHSHPTLTLNSFPYIDENSVLDTFIHEQLHWYLASISDKLSDAVAELRNKYPDAPWGFPLGCRDQTSTYEHLILCYLSHITLQGLVGDESAKLVLHYLQNHHYMWVYSTVEKDKDYIASVVATYGLDPPTKTSS